MEMMQNDAINDRFLVSLIIPPFPKYPQKKKENKKAFPTCPQDYIQSRHFPEE